MKRVVIALAFLSLVTVASLIAAISKNPHIIQLKYGYSVVIDEAGMDTLGYNKLKLMKSGKTIFLDTDNQYTDKDKVYPLVLHFGSNHDEVLLKFDQGPSKDEVIRLFIKDNSVVKLDTLPSFERGACDLASDSLPRFAAIWDHREEWNDSLGVQLADYEPILYYKVRSAGLILDSALTISINKKIYGKFYGYDISESKSFPASRINPRFAKELKKIKNARKINLDDY